MNKFHIPEQLSMVRSFLLQSSVEFTELLLQRTPHTNIGSVIGPKGYAPSEAHIPRDVLGNKMQLLAQINFSHIEAPKSFPVKGLVQFYVSTHCLETKQHFQGVLSQKNFKIMYIEQPDLDNHLLTHAAVPKSVRYPIKDTLQLTTRNSFEPVSKFDYRYEQYIPQLFREAYEITDYVPFDELYLQHYSGAQHKIGGYPYFIQEDLRKHSIELQMYDTLLLQIISDDAKGIMWGDSGIIKFFINEQDLVNLNFERAIMYVEDYT